MDTSYSPTPVRKTDKASDDRLFSFYEALRFIVEQNGRITRIEWIDPNQYFCIDNEDDGKLKVRLEDGVLRPLILRVVDIEATDWIKLNHR